MASALAGQSAAAADRSGEASQAQAELGPALGDKPGDVERVAIRGVVGTPLALADGRIALFHAGGELHQQSAYARYSEDNGASFGEPQKLFDFPSDRGSFGIGAALLSAQGTVHLFGLDYYGFDFNDRSKSKSYLWHARSRDGGKHWEPVQKVDFGLEYTGASNNAFELKSGRIIAPVSGLSDRRIGPWVSLAPYSDDDGATWNPPRQQITINTGAVNWYESGAAEPVGIELNDGRVWLLPRSQDGYQWQTFSEDGGLTWSPPQHTRFVSNQSAMAAIRLRDGRLMLFWNNCGAEGLGEIGWGHAERAVMAAAVSRDEGKTWAGYREVGRVTTNAQVSYPYVTQAADGRVILSAAGSLMRIDPGFLENRSFVEDFSMGVRRWSTLAAKGVEAASDPDGEPNAVLRMLRPDAAAPAAACLNFPYGERGALNLMVRIEPGFRGAHLTLSDHYDLPGLPRDASFPLQITPEGRIRIIGSGGTWLDTPGDIAPGKWHHLDLVWDCTKGRAVLRLDGMEIAVMEQYVRARGVCYLRIRSTATDTDSAGFYIGSVRVNVSS
ncbi:MAG: exo-alpha-sialidase [Armatimonadota bacterium]|nr:MAG: exo-alpha-sialidase [Armatimonadota bacterium]